MAGTGDTTRDTTGDTPGAPTPQEAQESSAQESGAATAWESARDRAAREAGPGFQRLYRICAPFRDFFATVNILFVPLTVALVAFAFLSVPQQTIEIYRYLFEGFSRQFAVDWSLFSTCADDVNCYRRVNSESIAQGAALDRGIYFQVLLAIFGVWLMARSLRMATAYAIGRLAFLAPNETRASRWILRWAPRAAHVLPILGFVLGAVSALSFDETTSDHAERIVRDDFAALQSPFAPYGADALTGLLGEISGDAGAPLPNGDRLLGGETIASKTGEAFFRIETKQGETITVNAAGLEVDGDGDVLPFVRGHSVNLHEVLYAPRAIYDRLESMTLTVLAVAFVLLGGVWGVADFFFAGRRRIQIWRGRETGETPEAAQPASFAEEWWGQIAARRVRRVRSMLMLMALVATPVTLEVLRTENILGDDSGAAALGGFFLLVAVGGGLAMFLKGFRPYYFNTLVLLGAAFGVLLLVGVVASLVFQQYAVAIGLILIVGVFHAVVGASGIILRLPRQGWRWAGAGARGVLTSAQGLILRLRARRARSGFVAHNAPPWPLWLQLGIVAAFGLCVYGAAYHPVAFSQNVGAFFLLAAFISLLGLMLTQLRVWGARLGMRFILFLIAFAVILSSSDWNDNHEVRRVAAEYGAEAAPGPQAPLPFELCRERSDRTEMDPTCSAQTAFLAWLESRADLADYQADPAQPLRGPAPGAERPYPVYIIAAQGGGIYAAAHAMQFMTRMQAFCPRFAQHVFAISSVSGGSVGAAFYAALAKRYAENVSAADAPCPGLEHATPESLDLEDAFRAAAAADAPTSRAAALRLRATMMHELGREMVSQDFLSPLFGGAFFPDLLQRFLPWPAPSLSRARALEAAFAASWEQSHRALEGRIDADAAFMDLLLGAGATEAAALAGLEPMAAAGGPLAPGENPLERGFLQHWLPDGAAPALLINTTETVSGRRRVIAPFVFGAGDGLSDLRLMPLARDYDIPLATAASLSARFPWLTPSGWFCDYRSEGDRNRAISRAVIESIVEAEGQPLTEDEQEAFFDELEAARDAALDVLDVCSTENRDLQKVRVVDGGYFENSGVTTALELVQDLSFLDASLRERGLNVAITLIVLTGGGDFSEASAPGLGEAMGPIRTMLATRTARTAIEIGRAEREADFTSDAALRYEVLYRAPIYDFVTPLPLGWLLSRASIDQIGAMAGEPSTCVDDYAKPADAAEVGAVLAQKLEWQRSTNCLHSWTLRALRGDG